jgi:coenzyme Q-binding protein COQ10
MRPLAGGLAADFPGTDCARLFDLAADIESYPRFIPWCRSARVLSRDGGAWEVDNHFGAGPVDVRFRSRAVPDPPGRLEITSADGPFRSFRLVWTFAALAGGGCRVAADYAVEFHSPLLRLLAGLGAHEAGRQVMDTFRARARTIYGG